MRIKIPNKITSELYGYNQIIRFIKSASDINNTTIELDFELVSFLEANLCAVLGVCFEILEKMVMKLNL
jgi:hypothetical protein